MAEPLYNVYRPLTLDQMWGQKKVVEAFKKYSKEGEFPRAIILTGNTGSGKTTLSNIISKSILCQHKDEFGNPCNQCSHCKTVMEEKISNFYYVNNASNLGIDEMRDLENTASIREMGVKHKVIIIDEFQEIFSNQKAAKNILKILEKQTSYTYFILCMMDDSKLNKAVKDRCVTFNLSKLSIEDIGSNLYEICNKEKVEIDTEEKANVLLAIADSVDGSMRGALSCLQRCIDSNIWTVEEAVKELNIISNKEVSTLLNHLLTGNIKALENIQANKELVDRIRYLMNILFKSKSGVEIEKYQKTLLQNVEVKSISETNIIIAYEELNKLLTLSYVPYDVIEYAFIRIVQRIKERTNALSGPQIEIKSEKEEPTRRRR